MSEDKNCQQTCSNCEQECSDRTAAFAAMKEKPHELSQIKHVIGIVSGKGGVGKSMVTSLLAVSLQKHGYRVGILDADITGPSIPKAFDLHHRPVSNVTGIYPIESLGGIKVMSLNLLLEAEDDPVVWRGPIIAGTVKQFWTEVVWGDLDFLLIDMPPGTGDVALTIFQSVPVDGVIIVSTPQQLVSLIVAKAVKMAQMMEIPILGLIENYSYYVCPHCDEPSYPFGQSNIEELAEHFSLPILATLPIDPRLAEAVDAGQVEAADGDPILSAVKNIRAQLGL